MKEIKLKVKKVSVIQVPHGCDEIRLVVDKPSPFPLDNYDCTVKIEVAAGRGREWLHNVFGIDMTDAHDKLGGNPDMFVYERNLEEEEQARTRRRKRKAAPGPFNGKTHTIH